MMNHIGCIGPDCPICPRLDLPGYERVKAHLTGKALTFDPENTIQISVSQFGLGDSLQGLAASAGLKFKNPKKHIVYSVKNANNMRFCALFGGYDSLVVGDVEKVTTIHPHDSYNLQLLRKTVGGRCSYYEQVTGAPCMLPEVRPINQEALDWAEPYRGCIVLSPFSHWAERTWLLASWLELEAKLAGKVVAIIDHAKGRTAGFEGAKIVAESPERIGALVANASLVVGNDSAMVHLAGVYSTPALALCGIVDGGKVYNIYESVQWLNGELGCTDCQWSGKKRADAGCNNTCASLWGISPNRVFLKIQEMLSAASAKPRKPIIPALRACCGSGHRPKI